VVDETDAVKVGLATTVEVLLETLLEDEELKLLAAVEVEAIDDLEVLEDLAAELVVRVTRVGLTGP
jgi:hypothetical protein